MFGGEAGPGKTKCLTVEAGRQVYHHRYRAIIFRRTNDELEQVRDEAQQMYPAMGGISTDRGNTWNFQSGAKIFLRYMQYEHDVYKYQGREFQYIAFDELTHFTEFQYTYMFTRCRSAAEGLLCYVRASANPGGVGHAWVKRRFVTACRPNKDRSYKRKFFKRVRDDETGQFVEVPAGAKDKDAYSRAFLPANRFDNPSIQDIAQYEAQIRALSDPILGEALLTGDWDIFAGQFFVKFNPQVHIIKPFEIPKWWLKIVGIDWGFADPCAVEWMAVDDTGPVPRVYGYDELYVNETNPDKICEIIKKRNARHNIGEPSFYYGGRDMWARNPLTWKREETEMYTEHTVANAFMNEGINVVPANQDRKQGWAHMHRLMDWEGEINDAGGITYAGATPKEQEESMPHYYSFAGRQPHLVNQIGDTIRDDHDPEDIDSKSEDHALEADRYGKMHLMMSTRPKKKDRVQEELAKILRETEGEGDLYQRRTA